MLTFTMDVSFEPQTSIWFDYFVRLYNKPKQLWLKI